MDSSLVVVFKTSWGISPQQRDHIAIQFPWKPNWDRKSSSLSRLLAPRTVEKALHHSCSPRPQLPRTVETECHSSGPRPQHQGQKRHSSISPVVLDPSTKDSGDRVSLQWSWTLAPRTVETQLHLSSGPGLQHTFLLCEC